jgi:integrase/recombinase XerD
LNLTEARHTYIQHKRALGLDYSSSAKTLKSFTAHTGNLTLERVTAREVLAFLDQVKISPATWEQKYNLLRGFFDYWLARGEIEVLPMPVKRKVQRRTFVPYIYTQTEILALLRAIPLALSNTRCRYDSHCIRTLLIFLYGTGVRPGEATQLLVEDLDLRRDRVTIRAKLSRPSRTIPIGSDLKRLLGEYLSSTHRRQAGDRHLFLTKAGKELNSCSVQGVFERVRKIAGIVRHDVKLQPRINDLRHTFAVHRIGGWIKHGAILNRMLPALAAYMGLNGFGATDRYLSLAPERFRTQLAKLSPRPRRGGKRWRDNPELMQFLAQLAKGPSPSRSAQPMALLPGRAPSMNRVRTRRQRV